MVTLNFVNAWARKNDKKVIEKYKSSGIFFLGLLAR